MKIKNFNIPSRKLRIIDLGLIDYQEAWDLQTSIHKDLINTKQIGQNQCHTLILCQHPHVFTMGKSGSDENLLVNDEELTKLEAQFYKINRGGDITYHGPGQLVAYPILDLDQIFTDVHRYVRSLEEAIIRTCAEYGIEAGRIKEFTGVWLDVHAMKPRKICAIGVHLSRWVSLHGLAFNVSPDLNYFNYILPCGIQPAEKEVTSLEKELNRKITFEEVKEKFVNHFIEIFEFEIIEKS